MILADVLVDEEIRAVASMASLALALLAFFTNMRREALASYRKKVSPFNLRTVGDALPDLLLALFTGGAVLAMAPLCFDSFHPTDHRRAFSESVVRQLSVANVLGKTAVPFGSAMGTAGFEPATSRV
jgi:hypothetical protein